MERAIPHDEMLTFLTNTSTVSVADLCSRELDILHRRMGASNHPDAFTLSALTLCFEMRPTADSPYGKVVALPHRDIADVRVGINLDGVSILGNCCGLT